MLSRSTLKLLNNKAGRSPYADTTATAHFYLSALFVAENDRAEERCALNWSRLLYLLPEVRNGTSSSAHGNIYRSDESPPRTLASA